MKEYLEKVAEPAKVSKDFYFSLDRGKRHLVNVF